MTIQYELECILSRLNQALEEYPESMDDPAKGYAFFTGYSRSAIQGASKDLAGIIERHCNSSN